MQEFVYFLIGQAFTAGAIYGAIRADITAANIKAGNAQESANDAHKRLDHFYDRRG